MIQNKELREGANQCDLEQLGVVELGLEGKEGV